MKKLNIILPCPVGKCHMELARNRTTVTSAVINGELSAVANTDNWHLECPVCFHEHYSAVCGFIAQQQYHSKHTLQAVIDRWNKYVKEFIDYEKT